MNFYNPFFFLNKGHNVNVFITEVIYIQFPINVTFHSIQMQSLIQKNNMHVIYI